MIILVWVYKSEDIVQTHQNFAQLHDCMTGTF